MSNTNVYFLCNYKYFLRQLQFSEFSGFSASRRTGWQPESRGPRRRRWFHEGRLRRQDREDKERQVQRADGAGDRRHRDALQRGTAGEVQEGDHSEVHGRHRGRQTWSAGG